MSPLRAILMRRPSRGLFKAYLNAEFNGYRKFITQILPPQVIARGSSSMLSSKTKVSENEYKDQAKMLLDRVRQRFLERPNDDSVYVPGLSFNRKMMELLYEGKPFHMRLTQEYNGSVRMEFGMILDIMVNYDSVEEAMEQCGESLYWIFSLHMHQQGLHRQEQRT
ncbi:hypothetical protein KP509_1Z169800 [Ceratopteris richardii]|nr:hypothetical protein KP509_1Z169800 [Ceratopteris richardii]